MQFQFLKFAEINVKLKVACEEMVVVCWKKFSDISHKRNNKKHACRICVCNMAVNFVHKTCSNKYSCLYILQVLC